jgi:hypothetical protein
MVERPSTPLRRASWYSCSRVRPPLLPARPLLPRDALGFEEREDEDRDEEDFDADGREDEDFDADGLDEDDFEAEGLCDDFEREDDLREFFASPDSARSLFTVRAAISSARLPCPRFS